MNKIAQFHREVSSNIRKLKKARSLHRDSLKWLIKVSPYKYVYNFTWFGRPIIQLPQDMMAMQEIIWKTKPDLIIETGVAHGGSLLYYAALLELLGGKRTVLGIDIDFRRHHRLELQKHPLARRIKILDGSSIDPVVATKAFQATRGKRNILVILDSNHTGDHVLKELEIYSKFVKKGNYIVVMDTVVEDAPPSLFKNRPWGKGNNPKTAVRKFLKTNKRFVIDKDIEAKLLLTVAPDGYLRCIKN